MKNTIQRKKIWVAIPAAILASVLMNTILYYIFSAMGFFPPDVLLPGDNKPLTVAPVVFSSILPVIVAGAFFAILARFSKNPVKIFTIVAGVLLVASFYNPFMIPGITTKMMIALNLMHIVVAVNAVYWFKKITNSVVVN